MLLLLRKNLPSRGVINNGGLLDTIFASSTIILFGNKLVGVSKKWSVFYESLPLCAHLLVVIPIDELVDEMGIRNRTIFCDSPSFLGEELKYARDDCFLVLSGNLLCVDWNSSIDIMTLIAEGL